MNAQNNFDPSRMNILLHLLDSHAKSKEVNSGFNLILFAFQIKRNISSTLFLPFILSFEVTRTEVTSMEKELPFISPTFFNFCK